MVGENTISGSLKYVTGYTGFSGDASEQSGHYLALHCESESGAVIKVEIDGGHHGAVTLDEDGIIIMRLEDPHQGIKVTATKSGASASRYFTLHDLEFKEA